MKDMAEKSLREKMGMLAGAVLLALSAAAQSQPLNPANVPPAALEAARAAAQAAANQPMPGAPGGVSVIGTGGCKVKTNLPATLNFFGGDERFNELQAAVMADDVAIAKKMLDACVNPDSLSTLGRTALMMITSAKMAELLVAYGADVRRVDNHGLNALHHVIAAPADELEKDAQEKIWAHLEGRGLGKRPGALANRKVSKAESELAFRAMAYSKTGEPITEALEKPSKKYANTPLHVAAFSGQENIVASILRDVKAVNADPRNVYGQTPLMALMFSKCGASGARQAIYEGLRAKGASLKVRDRLGMTAESWAAAMDEEALIKEGVSAEAKAAAKNAKPSLTGIGSSFCSKKKPQGLTDDLDRLF